MRKPTVFVLFSNGKKVSSNEEGIINVKSSSGAHDFRRKTGLAAGLNRLGLSSRGADQSTGKNWPADGPGFTLTEVLVVVAILAVLAAISFATISSMRTKADQMNTIGQMRHLAQATLGYAGEHGGQLPGHIPERWDVEVLRSLLGVGSNQKPAYNAEILQSPWDKIKRANSRSYAYSAALNNWFGWHYGFPQYTGARLTLVAEPSETAMYFTLFNELNVYESDNYVCALLPSFPDGKMDFIAFCDGSVRTFLKKDFPADPMEFFRKHVFLPNSF
jgi:prepilin-type N-terminal cleavage/methylation domain-containing protein